MRFISSFFSLEPKHSAATRWQRWIDRLENFLIAMDIDDTKRMKAMLLHYIGEELYGIYSTLPEIGATTDNEFVKAKKTLNEYFKPKRNVEFEIYNFRKAQQGPNEMLDEYYSRLKQLGANCEFTNIDKEIKSQIIQKGRSEKLRREGLCKEDISLTALLKLGRTFESSEAQSKAIEEGLGSGTSVKSVNKLKISKHKMVTEKGKKKKECYNCGGVWPHESRCPAYGKTCSTCGKKNHFSRMCRNKKDQSKPHVGRSSQMQKKKVNQVDLLEQCDPNDDDIYGMYHLFNVNAEKKEPYTCQLIINSVPISMEVDTGASLTIVNEESFKEIAEQNPSLHLCKTKLPVLQTYTGEGIKTMGRAKVDVQVNGDASKQLELTVVSGVGPNLIGRDWLSQIKLNWSQIFQVTHSKIEEILESHKEIFKEELGTLKGSSVHIHIDQDATPKYYKARPIP